MKPVRKPGEAVRVVTGNRGTPGNLDIVNPFPSGMIRRLETDGICTVGIYSSEADRTADAARLDASPTAAPTDHAPVTQITATASARAFAVGEAFNGQTLYVRLTAPATLIIKMGEA